MNDFTHFHNEFMYLYELNFMWLSLWNLQRYKVIDYLAKANPSTIIHILDSMCLSLGNRQRYKEEIPISTVAGYGNAHWV